MAFRGRVVCGDAAAQRTHAAAPSGTAASPLAAARARLEQR